MEWLLRDGPVYLVIVVVVSFIVFVAIRSRQNRK
jgi:uncharacterized protein (DUF983 family)